MDNSLKEERQMIMNVLDCLNIISVTKGEGSADKKRALLKNLINGGSQEMYLFYLLKTAFDPMWVTHINKIEVQPLNNYDTDFDIVKLVEMIRGVKAMNNDLRFIITSYVNSYPVTYRQILVNVLTKAMNIGIGIKEINKAFGKEVIRDVEIMKAEKGNSIVQGWFDSGREVWAEMKYDGIRAFAEMNDGRCISIKTYNFSEFDLTKTVNMVDQLEAMALNWNKRHENTHFFFDFEVTGRDRQSVGGEINSLLKGGKEVGCDENWIMNIFDIHPWGIFDGDKKEYSYSIRRGVLENIHEQVTFGRTLPNILIAERWKVTSMNELMKLFAEVLEKGCEGLVCKLADSPYELTRSMFWVKMKAEKECDLRVIGWYDGQPGTKRAGKIGGFICESEDGLLHVDIGGGFTDSRIDEIVTNGQDSYNGKIIKVVYNAVISKKDSTIKSLFLPRLPKGDWLRFDKNEADTLEKILKK